MRSQTKTSSQPVRTAKPNAASVSAGRRRSSVAPLRAAPRATRKARPVKRRTEEAWASPGGWSEKDTTDKGRATAARIRNARAALPRGAAPVFHAANAKGTRSATKNAHTLKKSHGWAHGPSSRPQFRGGGENCAQNGRTRSAAESATPAA